MPEQKPTGPRSSDATRNALIEAAIHLGGKDGFAATSTRTIALRAGTNVASIAYHFGGKEGLRLACGESIAARMTEALKAAKIPGKIDQASAVKALEATLTTLIRFIMLDQESSDVVRFTVREVSEQGPIVELLYEQVIGHRHTELCRLWEAATGMPAASEETRLTVFSLIGQVLYFRVGQSVVTRKMGWPDYQPEQVNQITRVLVANLRALISEKRKPTQ